MLKLRLQFFIVMLTLCGLLTAGLYLFINFSFKQDFWHYIEKKETRFAQPLIADLENNFRLHKDWNWLPKWEDYIVSHLDVRNRTRANAPGPDDKFAPPGFPPFGGPESGEFMKHKPDDKRGPSRSPDARDHADDDDKGAKADRERPDARAWREWRELRHMPPLVSLRNIFLLDADKRWVQGTNANIEDAFLIPLHSDDAVIGYLGIPFNPAIRDLQDASFAQGEEKKLTVIIFVALLITCLASFPLAHLLTKRIQLLVNQVNQLSRGNYQEKVSITGGDELTELAEHLNALGETLAQSEQTRRQWVADISHELRTPIAVLQAELEAMEDGVRALDKAAVKRLINHSARLKHLVNDLYELSLTDLGGMTYRKNAMDLGVLLQEAVSNMQPQFAQHQIDLSLKMQTPNLAFFGDYHRLQQLFSNLLKNSLHYTNAPGKTQVSFNLANSKAIIVIEDTAPGVAKEHHAKLFDRLYRADSSRNRATGGAGLGLSICKNIVAAHDGHISIDNSELGGLKVTITLPY
jgi:two-component system, OmpR family, sensor histidine kinase BaeS